MAKRGHAYAVTVVPIADVGATAPAAEALTFRHTNHDDLFAIVARLRAASGLTPDDAAAVGIGLKLLSEVMLQEKHNPLFDPLRPAIREFIGGLKAMVAERAAAEASATPGD